ncbi:hypothetical protein MIR68_001861 [Amoeboaphelidium protococcarum]|nr:hypothetical protein MIR68_001861 [Amoeboaphelidium protococcarum]
MPPTMSIRELLSIPQDQIAFATWRDSLKYNDTSVNGDKYVTCVSKKGHQRITPQLFDSYIQRGGFDFSSLLSDCPIDASLTRKRAQKSSDRAMSYYSSSRCTQESDGDGLKCALLGTVMCCASESDEDVRYQSCQQMQSFRFPGYILEGLNLHESRDQFQKRIQFATHNLPQDSFKCLFGLRSIQDVFTAVENGVDLFDSSLAYELTEQAKVFNLVSDGGETQSDAYSIMEPQFADDQSPLVHGCTCYSCQSYSKGYVQHLLTVKEILGSTLLMMHNLHQFIQFTQQLRQSAVDGSYLEFKQKYTKIQ